MVARHLASRHSRLMAVLAEVSQGGRAMEHEEDEPSDDSDGED
jgi:hypothetical protein